MSEKRIIENNGRACLEVWIRHGDYNGIEEVWDKKSLLLSESDFLEALLATLPHWMSALGSVEGKNRAVNALRKVSFTRDGTDSYKPVVCIRLCQVSSITWLSGSIRVLVPVETFAGDAIRHLEENPVLRTGNFLGGFDRQLKEKVEAISGVQPLFVS